MANLRHLWEEISATNDGKPSIFIVYTGETARGGFNQANTLHRVDRQWMVVVMRGHGFKNLMADKGDQTLSFYDVIETIRHLLRRMTNISEEFPIDYKGIEPMGNIGMNQSQNVFLDGFQIKFSTANDIPVVDENTPMTIN